MNNEAAELLEQALKLPAASRAALADSLIESLNESQDEDAEGAWNAEIERRVQELDSGAAQTVPWDDVRHALHQQLRR